MNFARWCEGLCWSPSLSSKGERGLLVGCVECNDLLIRQWRKASLQGVHALSCISEVLNEALACGICLGTGVAGGVYCVVLDKPTIAMGTACMCSKGTL